MEPGRAEAARTKAIAIKAGPVDCTGAEGKTRAVHLYDSAPNLIEISDHCE